MHSCTPWTWRHSYFKNRIPARPAVGRRRLQDMENGSERPVTATVVDARRRPFCRRRQQGSVTPMLPKTPPPRHWINPTTHSPFASFNTPRSLRIPAKFAAESSSQGDALAANSAPSDRNGQSPRTPSPMQQLPVRVESLKQTISHKIVMGRCLGDIDICSSSLSDECLRIITQKCRQLHTLRLLHICQSKQTSAPHALFFPNRAGEPELSRSGNKLFASCGCSHLSEKGFSDISVHCPDLISVTLVLQLFWTVSEVRGHLGVASLLHR